MGSLFTWGLLPLYTRRHLEAKQEETGYPLFQENLESLGHLKEKSVRSLAGKFFTYH